MQVSVPCLGSTVSRSSQPPRLRLPAWPPVPVSQQLLAMAVGEPSLLTASGPWHLGPAVLGSGFCTAMVPRD